jgi:hypothetical protein
MLLACMGARPIVAGLLAVSHSVLFSIVGSGTKNEVYSFCFSATLTYLRLNRVNAGKIVVQASIFDSEMCQQAGVSPTESIVQGYAV